MTLSPLQVDLIKGDISQNGIELKDLQYDLLDHICCILEFEGNDNKPFEEVYEETKKTYFPEGFREIQEQTNYLITQKYNNMKTVMNSIGIGSSAILMLGSIFKTFSLPSSNELLLFGAIGLTLGYLPILLILTLKQTDLLIGKFRNISGFLGAEAFVVGIFLQVLHFPVGKEVLFLGLGIIVMIFLPLLVKSAGKDALTKLQPATISVLLLAIVSTFFAFSNKKTSHNYRNELLSINANIERSLEAKNNRLSSLRTKNMESRVTPIAEDINQYITGLKKYIVLQIDPNNTANSMDSHNVMLNNDITNDILVTNHQNHQYNGPELLAKLLVLQSEITKINQSLQVTMLDNKMDDTWLKDSFYHKGLFNLYSTLSQIQLEVASLEIEVLNQLIINQ
jgi:hypothetical protein